jgi:hypothetical protein
VLGNDRSLEELGILDGMQLNVTECITNAGMRRIQASEPSDLLVFRQPIEVIEF